MNRLNLRTASPTVDEAQLLRASVLGGEAARDAYRRWLRAVDPTTLDHHSQVHLPALSRNLERLGITDAYTAHFREEWLQSWGTNTRLLKAGAKAVSALDAAGIATVVLKGAALIVDGVTPDPGSRMLGDVDVLVPYAAADAAAAALQDAGWQLLAPRSFADERRRGHSTAFANQRGDQVDLHWRATFDPADDTPLFERTRPASLAGTSTTVPAPADQLLLALLHGAGWHCTRLRWIADTALILDRHPDLDWELVVVEARRRAQAHQIATQLEIARSVLDVPVPGEVVAALRRDRLTVTERVLQRAKESSHWGAAIYLCSWDHARRSRALPQPVAEPYLTFVMVDHGLTRRRDLVWQVLTSPVRRLHALAVRVRDRAAGPSSRRGRSRVP